MLEPKLKRIHYDKFIVDFVEKDSSTYLHFYNTDKNNEPLIDKAVTKTFFFPMKNTGDIIEQKLKEFAPEVDYLKYNKATLLESRDRNGEIKTISPRELEVQKKYEELQKLYEERGVIHKSVTFNMLSGWLKEKIYCYVIPEINPFIDDLMLNMADELEALINKSN